MKDGSQEALKELGNLNERQNIQLWKAMTRLRPLLILLSLVDTIKTKWDCVRMQITESSDLNKPTVDYLRSLNTEYLCKGNLKQLNEDCNMFNKEYQDRILKINSLEKFMEQLQLEDVYKKENQSLTEFVLVHFRT